MQRKSKLYQVSKSKLNYFSKVSQVCKILIKLTPIYYVADLTFPPEIITGAIGAVNIICKTKRAIKKCWDEKIAIATSNFIMVQIFIRVLNLK
jgi:hypothetical protein